MKTDQQQLRDYLLGRLPEDLATEMDTRLFASNELNRELQDEQDSLIEDFVYSRLTSVEEDAFQAQCARSQMLQEKVRSFRVFLSAIERLPDAKPSPLTLRFQQLLGILSPALALLLCFASFLYTRELRRNALLSSQLLASSRTDGSNAATNEDGRATVVAFLSANVPRGASTAPEVKVPATAHLLELQVEPIGTWNCCTTPKSSGRPLTSHCIELGRKPFSLCRSIQAPSAPARTSFDIRCTQTTEQPNPGHSI